ncbi:MAG: hypothetical protein MUC35_02140 [Candidatus Margulisbacteria bacterium]|jgi:hypothetical protein|nr:hypothetical protein [Candidatus Margulisiibacteriota bacterium]
MIDISGVGAFGYLPYLSDDLIKQAKYKDIRTRAGKVAYLMTLGKEAKKPQIKEGVHDAGGALKWLKEELLDEK